MGGTLSLSIALAAATAAPAQCAPKPGDAAAIDRTIRDFYGALEKQDRAGYDRQVTGDFTSFDGGAKFTAPQLFDLIGEAYRGGKIYQWQVGSVAAHIDCQTAWAKWDTRGASGTAGKMVPRHWLDSAVLRRSPSGWRIEFFHSTPVRVAN